MPRFVFRSDSTALNEVYFAFNLGSDPHGVQNSGPFQLSDSPSDTLRCAPTSGTALNLMQLRGRTLCSPGATWSPSKMLSSFRGTGRWTGVGTHRDDKGQSNALILLGGLPLPFLFTVKFSLKSEGG